MVTSVVWLASVELISWGSAVLNCHPGWGSYDYPSTRSQDGASCVASKEWGKTLEDSSSLFYCIGKGIYIYLKKLSATKKDIWFKDNDTWGIRHVPVITWPKASVPPPSPASTIAAENWYGFSKFYRQSLYPSGHVWAQKQMYKLCIVCMKNIYGGFWLVQFGSLTLRIALAKDTQQLRGMGTGPSASPASTASTANSKMDQDKEAFVFLWFPTWCLRSP